MSPERAKELLPVFQAFAEGKQIQLRLGARPGHAHELEQWEDVSQPLWLPACEYRIKPAPVECDMWYHPALNQFVVGEGQVYVTHGWKKIKMREVIE